MVLFVVGCSSGSGSGVGSSVSRLAQVTTIPGAPARPPTTDPPAEATDAPATPTTAVAATPAPETTTPAADDDGGGSPWWPWLLAALAVAAVVIGVVALRRRPRQQTAAPSAAPPLPAASSAAVLAQSDELTTHLVGLAPTGLAAVAGADADRLASLITMVEQLTTAAPEEAARRALVALHEPMRALHGALDAMALAPRTPSDAEVADIRARATTLHSATALARATLLPAPGSPL
jgi:hypothetical protein